MRTIEDFRAMLERRDPTQLGRDIADAMEWARTLSRLSTSCPAEVRSKVEEHLIRCIVIASGEAEFTGAARVVSAALRASAERVRSAKQYGRASAELAMERAGFSKADYEITPDDIDAMVRAEMRRVLVAGGHEDIAYELYDE